MLSIKDAKKASFKETLRKHQDLIARRAMNRKMFGYIPDKLTEEDIHEIKSIYTSTLKESKKRWDWTNKFNNIEKKLSRGTFVAVASFITSFFLPISLSPIIDIGIIYSLYNYISGTFQMGKISSNYKKFINKFNYAYSKKRLKELEPGDIVFVNNGPILIPSSASKGISGIHVAYRNAYGNVLDKLPDGKEKEIMKVRRLIECVRIAIKYHDDKRSFDIMNLEENIAAFSGVCKEQAAVLHLLLRRENIKSWYAVGKIKKSDPEQNGHAWVKVKIDNEYFIADATNNILIQNFDSDKYYIQRQLRVISGRSMIGKKILEKQR